VKLRVAKGELSLLEAFIQAGLEVPEALRTGASSPAAAAPAAAPVPASDVATDARGARRAEAQRKLALMQRLPSELKLRVAKREIGLEEALKEAGIEPGGSA
jgi:hypothetical protein